MENHRKSHLILDFKLIVTTQKNNQYPYFHTRETDLLQNKCIPSNKIGIETIVMKII